MLVFSANVRHCEEQVFFSHLAKEPQDSERLSNLLRVTQQSLASNSGLLALPFLSSSIDHGTILGGGGGEWAGSHSYSLRSGLPGWMVPGQVHHSADSSNSRWGGLRGSQRPMEAVYGLSFLRFSLRSLSPQPFLVHPLRWGSRIGENHAVMKTFLLGLCQPEDRTENKCASFCAAERNSCIVRKGLLVSHLEFLAKYVTKGCLILCFRSSFRVQRSFCPFHYLTDCLEVGFWVVFADQWRTYCMSLVQSLK